MTKIILIMLLFFSIIANRKTQALSVLHAEVSADTEQADPQKPTLGTAFQQLLQTIQASACPSYTAVTLLRALDHVNGEVRARARGLCV